jgi:anti-sigma regulatory factor (Ser/Thr protein kinase)
MRLGSGPEAAASARSALSRLRADLDQPLIETLRLLVTELVTNSVRHTAADSLTLSVAIGRSAVLTEVADTGPGFDPQCVENSGNEDTGWGLFLVERLADKWGVRHDGPSKRVWFELRRA